MALSVKKNENHLANGEFALMVYRMVRELEDYPLNFPQYTFDRELLRSIKSLKKITQKVIKRNL